MPPSERNRFFTVGRAPLAFPVFHLSRETPDSMKADTPSPTDAESKARCAAAPRPDRMMRLETIPALKEEAETIRLMAELYCKAHHPEGRSSEDGLCPDCRAFVEYARKRLACCPYGAEKPVCAKCRIHCYKPAEREKAREIMRWAGPRLLWHHPILTLKHLLKERREAPEKPRNRRETTPAAAPKGAPKSPSDAGAR